MFVFICESNPYTCTDCDHYLVGPYKWAKNVLQSPPFQIPGSATGSFHSPCSLCPLLFPLPFSYSLYSLFRSSSPSSLHPTLFPLFAPTLFLVHADYCSTSIPNNAQCLPHGKLYTLCDDFLNSLSQKNLGGKLKWFGGGGGGGKLPPP